MVALVAAGVVLLHQVAYLLAHPDPVARAAAAEGHAYLAPLAEVVVPVGLAVVVWLLALRTARLWGGVAVAVAPLTGLVAAGYLTLEVGERVVRGAGATAALTEPAVWLGLALAPLLALLTHRLLHVGLAAAELAPPAVVALAGRGLLLAWPAPPALTAGRPHQHRARGPPVGTD